MQLPQTFTAKVISGRGVGRKLGFPTLNFKEAPENLAYGVYAGYVDEYPAAFSYGPRATFGIEEALLEAHLLDFNSNWEKKDAKVQLKYFLRENLKFQSEKELVRQIAQDVKKSKNILNGAHDRT